MRSFDINAARDQVRRLRAVSGDLSRIQAAIQQISREVPGFWSGAAAKAFLDSITDMRTRITASETEAASLATLVSTVSDQINQEELAAIAAAQAAAEAAARAAQTAAQTAAQSAAQVSRDAISKLLGGR
jgi:hypothetical protein